MIILYARERRGEHVSWYSRFHLGSNIAYCIREAVQVHSLVVEAMECHGIKGCT